VFGFNVKKFSGQKTSRPAKVNLHVETLETRELMSAAPLAATMGPIAPLPQQEQTAVIQTIGVDTNYVAGDYVTFLNSAANNAVSGNNGEVVDPTRPPPTTNTTGLAIINSLTDATVRDLALARYQADGWISREDLIDIFNAGSKNFLDLSNNAFASMKKLIDYGAKVNMPDYVRFLGHKVMNASTTGTPNAPTFQGYVNDFFLGLNRPTTGAGTSGYNQVNEPLWNGNPRAEDIHVRAGGYMWSNWLMTGLEEIVARNPSYITSMFINNADNTYTVRFFDLNGAPIYVTVDNYLPSSAAEFGHNYTCKVLWPALIIKAYAQANAYSNKLKTLDGSWANSYTAVGMPKNGVSHSTNADPTWIWKAITGLNGTSVAATNQSLIVEKWLQGHFVALKTAPLGYASIAGIGKRDGASILLYPGHVRKPNDLNPTQHWYALVNYVPDAEWGGRFTVTQDGKRFVEVAGKVLASNFSGWVSTTGSTPPVPVAKAATVGDGVNIQNAVEISHFLNNNTGQFVDQDGDVYTVKLTGPGKVHVQIDDPDGDGNGPIAQIRVLDSNAVASSLAVTVKKAKGGDGAVTIGDIEGQAFKSINAAASDLVGAITVDGHLGGLTLRSATDAAHVEAASLGTLTTKGDFDANLKLHGSSAALDLNSANIGGGISDSVWSILGDVGTLTVKGNVFNWGASIQGSLNKGAFAEMNHARLSVAHSVQSMAMKNFLNSHLLAGVVPTVAGYSLLPGIAAGNRGQIGSFTVSGVAKSRDAAFANSNVVANKIGKATLASVQVDNLGVAYGVIAHESIGAVTVKSPKFVYNPAITSPQSIDDFVVKVI